MMSIFQNDRSITTPNNQYLKGTGHYLEFLKIIVSINTYLVESNEELNFLFKY